MWSSACPAGRGADLAIAVVVCAAPVAVRLAGGVAHDDTLQSRGICGLRGIDLFMPKGVSIMNELKTVIMYYTLHQSAAYLSTIG